MAVYLIESNNDEIYKKDVRFLDSTFYLRTYQSLTDFNEGIVQRIVQTVRKVLEIKPGFSIEEQYKDEGYENIENIVERDIIDIFDNLEANCNGEITEDLRNLGYLVYGDNWISSM